MRRLLGIMITLALALGLGVIGSKPAAAADPVDYLTQLSLDVTPKNPIFSTPENLSVIEKIKMAEPVGYTFIRGVTWDPSSCTPAQWVWDDENMFETLVWDFDGCTYWGNTTQSETDGNERVVTVNNSLPNIRSDGEINRGWVTTALIYENAAGDRVVYQVMDNGNWGDGTFIVGSSSRVSLTGPAEINRGDSLTLAGKFEFFDKSWAGAQNELNIQFKPSGSDEWSDMKTLSTKADGTYSAYFPAVPDSGTWRAQALWDAVDEDGVLTMSDERIITVKVPNQPKANAPALSVKAKSFNTVSLAWDDPTRPGGEIVGYRFGWTSASGKPVPSWSKVYSDPEWPFVMTNLAPSSKYSMWLEVITEAGTGARTTIDVTTAPAPPKPVTAPGKPRAPKIARYARSAKLSWAAPASNGGAAINAYQVKRGASVKTLKASARSYTFTGLRPLTRHTFYVRAHNKAGWGPWLAAATTTKAPAAKAYRTCAALNYDYPHGVGKPGAKDKGSGVTNFYRSTKTYKMNDGRNKKKHQYDLDRDNDKIACEKR